MPKLHILLDDDPTNGAFQEAHERLKDREVIRGEITVIGALPKGMSGGRTSIFLSVELEDGRVAFAETSLALFQVAAAAFHGRYGDETDGKTHEGGPN